MITIFGDWVGSKYAVAVSSCTAALHLALIAVGVGKDDEVITVSHSFIATANSIRYCGANPVFVDIDKDCYTIDPFEIVKSITKRTRAIVVVHIYGQACQMDEIISISNQYEIPIIEDCAQATGAEYKEKKVGSMGVVGCFSFFPTKNLSCIGDG